MSRSARIFSLPASPKVRERQYGIRQRILAESARLFISKGFDNVSVEEIIAAAAIARSSFYRFFANREEVLSSMIRPLFERGIECLGAVEPGDAATVVDGVCDTYLSLWRMSADALRVSVRTGGVHFDLFSDLHGPFRNRLIGLLESADPRHFLNGNADYTARLVARTAVPALEVYAKDPDFERLFRRSLRGL